MDHCAGIPASAYTRCFKRTLDLAGATMIGALMLPFFLLITLVIKLTSPGPVFFVQERAGRNGRVFRLVKFRTMRSDRNPDARELVPLGHPDITSFGRLLRRFKLDELPQVLNVLRGDMSIVGPRPTLPDQAERYTEFQRQRLRVRPGLTGLAQVYSSASRPWNERILYDIAYVRRCSLPLDLRILMRTPMTLLMGEERTARPFSASSFASCVPLPPPEEMPDPVSG